MQRDSFRITLQNYYSKLSQSGGGEFFLRNYLRFIQVLPELVL